MVSLIKKQLDSQFNAAHLTISADPSRVAAVCLSGLGHFLFDRFTPALKLSCGIICLKSVTTIRRI